MMGEKIPNTLYHIDKHIDQLQDSQKDWDDGILGEKIPNTLYHFDKHIDQLYDSQ